MEKIKPPRIWELASFNQFCTWRVLIQYIQYVFYGKKSYPQKKEHQSWGSVLSWGGSGSIATCLDVPPLSGFSISHAGYAAVPLLVDVYHISPVFGVVTVIRRASFQVGIQIHRTLRPFNFMNSCHKEHLSPAIGWIRGTVCPLPNYPLSSLYFFCDNPAQCVPP